MNRITRVTRRSRRTAVALAVLIASWGLALASLVIAWAFALAETPVPRAFLSEAPVAIVSRFDDIGVAVALIYGALAALLIVRRPHPVATVLAVHAVGSGVTAFGLQWGVLGEEIPGLPLVGLLAHAAGWGYVPGTFATTVIPLMLLRSRAAVHRGLVVVGFGIAGAATLFTITNQSPELPRNPFAVPDAGYQLALPELYGACAVAALGVSAIVAGMLVVRWIRARSDERARLGWLTIGHGFLTLSYASLVIPAELALPEGVLLFGRIAPVVGQLLYPAAVLVMVLGPRVGGIDFIVSRALTGLLIASLVAGAYLLLDSLFIASGTLSARVSGILSAATAVIATLPAHAWIRTRVDRLVYPGGRPPHELVRRLGRRLGEIESGREGIAALAAGLRDALRLGGVELAAVGSAPTEGSAESLRVRSGTLREPAWRLSLLAGGRAIGELAVSPRRGERIPRRTRSQLAELTAPITAVLQLAQAGAELERARLRVLAARSAQRRALRRELHDGIGPALAGVGYGVAAVGALVDEDPRAARELAERLLRDLRLRLAETRDLARDLSGSERGLAAGLAALAETFRGAGPRVETAGLLAACERRLDPAARRAALRIAAEAVHNAVRHARAELVRIELGAGPGRTDPESHVGTVVLTIHDDGCGIPVATGDGGPVSGRGPGPDPGPDRGSGRSLGLGLATMREQAAEAGGTLDIVSAPGSGTTVRAVFPMHDSLRAEEER